MFLQPLNQYLLFVVTYQLLKLQVLLKPACLFQTQVIPKRDQCPRKSTEILI